MFFSLVEVEWSFAGFRVALPIPGTLVYASAVLMRREPDTVGSWHDHHRSVRRRWYRVLALWAVSAASSATVNLGMDLLHPARGLQATAFAIGLIGAMSRSDRAHRMLVLVRAAMTIGTLIVQVDAEFLRSFSG